ncbi:hypothetical protein LSAT2_029034 [Lamellibrachia satsuma]|nr:hypothetical protein LSAT2_029034 [Lamellibrachia satsuma]
MTTPNLSDTIFNFSGLVVNETEEYIYDVIPSSDMKHRAEAILSQPDTMISVILGILALSANMLSLLALVNLSTGIPHARLIMSLAASDMLIAVSLVLHVINKIMNPLDYLGAGPSAVRLRSHCLHMVIKALNTTALNVTLLNLLGMALDHHIAIMKPLHYHMLMNHRRSIIMISLFWVVATVCGFSDVIVSIMNPRYMRLHHRYNFCEFVYISRYQEEYTVFAIAFVCFVAMAFAYIGICVTVCKLHNQQSSYGGNFRQNKKALCTTFLILGTFVVCWIPICAFQLIMIVQVKMNPEMVQRWMYLLGQVDSYMYNLLLVNALCDPIIYAVRMREMRQSYISLFKSACMLHHKGTLSRQLPQRERSMSFDRKFSKVSLLSSRSTEHAHTQQSQHSQLLCQTESAV